MIKTAAEAPDRTPHREKTSSQSDVNSVAILYVVKKITQARAVWRPSDCKIGDVREISSGQNVKTIHIKRVYEPAAATDGKRFLVDGLWPRGLKKDTLKMESWIREVAPSANLRKWFKHDPAKWDGFQKRYHAELAAAPEHWQPLLAAAKKGNLTLLFGARDPEHNNATVLKAFLEEKMRR